MEQYFLILTILLTICTYYAETETSLYRSIGSISDDTEKWIEGSMLDQIKAVANNCDKELKIDATKPGEIRSPNYDKGSYMKDLSCSYKIQAPFGYRIKITFTGFDIKPSKLCKKDRLIFSGQDGNLGVFCGYDIPRPVLSHENEVQVLFQTKTSDGRGFVIQYEASPGMELCRRRQTVCRNRNCYKNSRKCDGIDDCGDGTDEENCDFPVAKLSDDNCGNTPIKPKNLYVDNNTLVGAVPNSWPWQVSLQYSEIEPNGHFCGGTLISPQWVISAAHCFTSIKHPNDVRVVLGSHYQFVKSEYEVNRVAERIIPYPIIAYPGLDGEELKIANYRNDIALIKLNAPVNFTDGVQPACLWGFGVMSGWKCYSTGWGETSPTTEYSKELKQSIQFIQDTEQCPHHENTQICVEKPSSDACLGDSGGPLVCFLRDKWRLMGSASYNAAGDKYRFGKLCKPNESKLIFANINHKMNWIEKTVNENR